MAISGGVPMAAHGEISMAAVSMEAAVRPRRRATPPTRPQEMQ